MKTLTGKFTTLFVLLTAAVLAGAAPAAESGAKLKVLIVTGGHGFERDPFFKVFAENAGIAFVEAKQGKASEAYEREDLLSHDVVVLYDMVQNITETQKARFLSLLEKGVGLVVMHHAFCSYQNWPDFERIIGGKYLIADEKKDGRIVPKSGYQHDVDMPIRVVAKDHPITAGLKDFNIFDEVYSDFRVRPDVTPLITTTHPKSGKPLAWTRTEGKSRVVFIQLGHGPTAYENPNFRQIVARSIRWSAKR